MRDRFAYIAGLVLLGSLSTRCLAADEPGTLLDQQFTKSVQPFIQNYCTSCHGGDKPEASLNLETYKSMSSVMKDRHWNMVLLRIKAGEMPPDNAADKPTAAERAAAVDWFQAARRYESDRNAGDPGMVLARRLSNAEYDYTIRDLTGVDIRPTKEFPVDPANEAGFDNSGESLAMSPALVKKYLDAARLVADYIVFKPDGFSFAPYPMVAETDRDKYAVNHIVDFYKKQPIDYADYFEAAWRYQNRAALGKPDASIDDIAKDAKVSAKYLNTIISTVTTPAEPSGPIAAIQAYWKKLAAPVAGKQPDAVRKKCEEMREFIVELRPFVKYEFGNLPARGIAPGSQTLVLWKDKQYAANRMNYPGNAMTLDMAYYTDSDPLMLVPETEEGKAVYQAAFRRFCSIFPDAFYISERARMFLTNPREIAEDLKGHRLLTAGFHSQMGFFRDDQPLCELILTDAEKAELDELWKELDFIAYAPIRQFKQFVWFERAEPPSFMYSPEFNDFRSEDDSITTSEKITKLSEAYLAKVEKLNVSETAYDVVKDYFPEMDGRIRALEAAQKAAEPSHLQTLLGFAEKAYRRPLADAEKQAVLAFYRASRAEAGLDHESAIRDTVVSILMSPYFCYRIDPAQSGTANIQPLSDYALASRLSYFLWASAPDAELLSHAASGDLHQPAVILAQTRRMLKDAKIRGLATEFGGNWLDVRRFEELNSVDRERFPTFTNDLRSAMFEEPIRFIMDAVQNDRPVLDFIYGNYTFVNAVLAKHYGMPEVSGGADNWVRIDNAGKYQRGGLLPMSAFLTKNAPGLRTSPVKRGYWVVRRLLGEHIPAPPPNVPVLPTDETKLGDLTLRQALAKHREDKSCSTCHEKFDSVGVVFESFGPVGEWRTLDLAGRPVEVNATFPDGSSGSGIDGLRTYLKEKRQPEFINNLCEKLLVYALGRSLIPSDDVLLDQMREKLGRENNRFDSMIETIVVSPQFTNRRSQLATAKE